MWHHPNHKPHSAEYGGQPYINDEFGGIVYVPPERRTEEDKKKSWGYGSRPNDPEHYYALIKAEVNAQNAVPTRQGDSS